jgi:hypothetical protein
MKLLYEESPKSFEELIAILLSADVIIVGPTLEQQSKSEQSIPDLSITHEAYSIFFETKTGVTVLRNGTSLPRGHFVPESPTGYLNPPLKV